PPARGPARPPRPAGRPREPLRGRGGAGGGRRREAPDGPLLEGPGVRRGRALRRGPAPQRRPAAGGGGPRDRPREAAGGGAGRRGGAEARGAGGGGGPEAPLRRALPRPRPPGRDRLEGRAPAAAGLAGDAADAPARRG